MSIRIPETNVTQTGDVGVTLPLPAAAGNKSASTACVVGCFFRSPVNGSEENYSRTLMTRESGGTGGNDGYIQVSQNGVSIESRYRNGGNNLFDTSISGLTPGLPYLVMLIVNPLRIHLVACTPGGTPIVSTVEGAGIYTASMTTRPFLSSLIGSGGPNNRLYYGPYEEAFYLSGEFPEASSIPDSTLIQNIADGSQDLATLDAQLTGGVKRFRYRLQNEADLSDAYGLVDDLVPSNIDAATGKRLYTSGPLRPKALMPALTSDGVSQVLFGTAANSATATATINIEGGTYSGITPAAIQARLVNESGTAIVDWSTVDDDPDSGAWVGTSFSGVLMTASYFRTEFRAVDGVDDAIGETSHSYGLKGAGFRMLTQAQSQLMYLFINGSGLAITSGIRLLCIKTSSVTSPFVLSSSSDNIRGVRRGIRQLAIEINALFPGVPIQIDSVGEPGTPISDFYPPGNKAVRWGIQKTFNGVIQPFYQLFMGHSEDTGSTYQSKVAEIVTYAEAQYGQGIKNLHVPVPRYHGAGATLTGNALAVDQSRRGAKAHCVANPVRNKWMGSWSSIKTDESGSDPHPSDDAEGQGRCGTLLALSLLSVCRAIVDEPLEFKTATASGSTSVILTLGRVNESMTS